MCACVRGSELIQGRNIRVSECVCVCEGVRVGEGVWVWSRLCVPVCKCGWV